MFEYPDTLDMLTHFNLDPDENSVPEDGYFSYTFDEKNDIQLKFAFHLFENFVRTTLYVHRHLVQTVEHEKVQHIRIEKSENFPIIHVKCAAGYHRTECKIIFSEPMQIRWNTFSDEI